MKLKLTDHQLSVLILCLRDCENVTFDVHLERRLITAILKDFLKKLLKKSIDSKEKMTVELDDQTLLSLNFVLPQLRTGNVLQNVMMADLYQKINQACLSI